jgi:feruloyl esterase
VPLDASGIGQAGPFFLQAGIGSTAAIAEFFGLPVGQPQGKAQGQARPASGPSSRPVIDQEGNRAEKAAEDFTLGGIKLDSIDPNGVIRKALTAAGLMKG